MNYYRNQVTQKSWLLLQQLSKKYRFVLIGGWAVWLYTHQLKSKDIDLIVEFDQLEKLRQDFSLTKNERLKKYEVVQDEIQIDIYVPHYSQLGTPTEKILNTAVSLEGFRVPPPEILLTLKQTAYQSRASSSKGQKDLVDIVSLLSLSQLDWTKVPPEVVSTAARQIDMPELNFNRHQFSRLKKSWSGNLQATLIP